MNPTQAELLESYTRSFSAIEGLQEAYRVGYALYDNAGQLGVVVCRETKAGVPRVVRCTLRDVDRTFGRRLLRFLYENAVQPESACDIIRDVCGAAVEGTA